MLLIFFSLLSIVFFNIHEQSYDGDVLGIRDGNQICWREIKSYTIILRFEFILVCDKRNDNIPCHELMIIVLKNYGIKDRQGHTIIIVE